MASWCLGKVSHTNQLMVTSALHHAFITLSAITIISSVTFWSLRKEDGESISRGMERQQTAPAVT